MNRREFLRRIAVSSALGLVAVSGLVVLFDKFGASSLGAGQQYGPTVAVAQSQTSTTGSTASTQLSNVPSGYLYLAPLSAVAGKSYAYFNHPNFGSSILLNDAGKWRAFSAICTHAGCTVNFTGSEIYCPCHGGYFSATNGSVISGPPPTKLQEYDVITANNALYVGTSVIN